MVVFAAGVIVGFVGAWALKHYADILLKSKKAHKKLIS